MSSPTDAAPTDAAQIPTHVSIPLYRTASTYADPELMRRNWDCHDIASEVLLQPGVTEDRKLQISATLTEISRGLLELENIVDLFRRAIEENVEIRELLSDEQRCHFYDYVF